MLPLLAFAVCSKVYVCIVLAHLKPLKHWFYLIVPPLSSFSTAETSDALVLWFVLVLFIFRCFFNVCIAATIDYCSGINYLSCGVAVVCYC